MQVSVWKKVKLIKPPHYLEKTTVNILIHFIFVFSMHPDMNVHVLNLS